MIEVTKPFLPPKGAYLKLIDGIWERQWLTNNGPLVKQLEEELSLLLGLDDMVFLSNGTIALQLAIKALDIHKEIITTPFSYVATTSSIVWENCKPVFVDIDPNTFNLDPKLIENSINSNTEAILATHVFGNPCDIEGIQKVADKYNLKVIYDAAHSFNVKYNNQSIFSFGDISTTSFHATKLFHTIEGGGLFSNQAGNITKAKFMRNFGHDGPEKFAGVGINGKNSEFHAAMGLVNIKYIDHIIAERQRVCDVYKNELNDEQIQFQQWNSSATKNYAYFPVLFTESSLIERVIRKLHENKVYPRRYFYPPLNTLPYVDNAFLPETKKVSNNILCLPLYPDLKNTETLYICDIIKSALK